MTARSAIPRIFLALWVAIPVLAPSSRAQQDDPLPPTLEFEFPFAPPLPPELAPDLFLVQKVTPPREWPLPWRQVRFRNASGGIPPKCLVLMNDPEGAVLDCWLQRNPVIADAIVWEFAPMRHSRWRFWTEAQKAELRRAFVAARIWRAMGFVGPWPADAFVDPPPNQELPYWRPDAIGLTVLSSEDARRRHLSAVAVSLASEIDAWMPWSLRDYNAEMLRAIFDATRLYAPDRDDGGPLDSVFPGHIVQGLTQAHAATIYRFLRDENLIGGTPLETIDRVLTWSRDHMLHSFTIRLSDGTEVPRRVLWETFWDYSGLAPVSEMIRGKEAFHPALGLVVPGVYHWTYGCAGTTRFLRAILAVVNIPVQEFLSRRTCGHSMAFFAGEGRYLSHSDDPYDQLFNTSDFSGGQLLVPTHTWNRWFPAGDEETSCRNVGRQVIDLNVLRRATPSWPSIATT